MKRAWFPRLVLGGAFCAAAASITFTSATFGSTESAVPTPSVRRLTEAQYRRSIAATFGNDIEVVGRFEPDLRVDGLMAVGASAVSITPSGLEQYNAIGRNIAEQVVDAKHRDRLVGCAPGSSDPHGAKCASAFFTRVGLPLFRRPLTQAEVRAATAHTLAGAKTLGGFDAGLAATLAGMLSSPDFLFRIDAPARSGPAGAIDDYSKATRLSFLLWDAPPDDALLAAAHMHTLDTPAGLQAQVDRMIASPRFADGVRAFFTDFLQLDEIDQLSKDALIFPAFSSSVAEATREQTLRTVVDLLVTHKGDYRDLFTTRRFAMTRALGPIYDVPISKSGWFIYEFPPGDPRTGLLTQASLLALHSHPGRTSPTRRGKAIRETLLCEQIPSPPANVNFAVVQDVNNPTLKTTRQRLEAHLDDEDCASCHRKTDGLGLSLEKFDGAGEFRTAERGEVIDVTGSLDKTKFDGAAQLGQLFHDSPKITQCLVKTMWRYATGLSLGDNGDTDELARLNTRFAADGYRLVGLMRTIALDPAFYAMARVPRPDPVHSARADTNKGASS